MNTKIQFTKRDKESYPPTPITWDLNLLTVEIRGRDDLVPKLVQKIKEFAKEEGLTE